MQSYFGFFFTKLNRHLWQASKVVSIGVFQLLDKYGGPNTPGIRDVEVCLDVFSTHLNHQMEKSHDLCKWFKRLIFGSNMNLPTVSCRCSWCLLKSCPVANQVFSTSKTPKTGSFYENLDQNLPFQISWMFGEAEFGDILPEDFSMLTI